MRVSAVQMTGIQTGMVRGIRNPGEVIEDPTVQRQGIKIRQKEEVKEKWIERNVITDHVEVEVTPQTPKLKYAILAVQGQGHLIGHQGHHVVDPQKVTHEVEECQMTEFHLTREGETVTTRMTVIRE